MLPFPDRRQQEDLFQSVLRAANVTSFVALQRVSSQALMEANNVVGTPAAYGTFAFGEQQHVLMYVSSERTINGSQDPLSTEILATFPVLQGFFSKKVFSIHPSS
jgi:hypothetical protein